MTDSTEQVGEVTLHEGSIENASTLVNQERNRTRRFHRIAGALSGIVLTVSGCSPAYAPEATEYAVEAMAGTDRRPGIDNAIFFVVDDENDFSCTDAKKFLPKSSKWLVDKGICFENATVEDPVCCPARADIMTGQYTHNNGVRRQIDADEFRATDSLQGDLSQRGYVTYGIGKFLNGINAGDLKTGEFNSGFNRNQFWSEYKYRNYHLYRDNGTAYLPEKDIHTTTRTGRGVRSLIQQTTRADRPFFAYAAFYAPHNEKVDPSSGPRTTNVWPKPTDIHKDAPVPPFTFDVERNREDKIALFQHNHIPERKVRAMNKAKVRSVYDVDLQMAKTFRTLERTGELDNTAVFFTSDNGYVLSNWWNGKGVPHRDAWNVPMMMYIPGSPDAGTVDYRNVNLVDITATAYDVLNVRPKHTLDGHSLLTDFDRKAVFHQFGSENSDLAIAESGSQAASVPSWAALETPKGIYVEWYQNRKRPNQITRREFYAPDDKDQKRNLMHRSFADQKPPRALIQKMSKRLHRLKKCSGTAPGRNNPCQ